MRAFIVAQSNGRNTLWPTWYWTLSLCVCAPVATLGLCILTLVDNTQKNGYGGYPVWLQAVGWSIFSSLLALVIASIAWKRGPGTLKSLAPAAPALAAAEGVAVRM